MLLFREGNGPREGERDQQNRGEELIMNSHKQEGISRAGGLVELKVTALEGNTDKTIHLCSDLRENWCGAVVVAESRLQGINEAGTGKVAEEECWVEASENSHIRQGLGRARSQQLLQENERPPGPV